jgi:hypothetical protein
MRLNDTKRNLLFIATSLAVLGSPKVYADDQGEGQRHVLLISIDGMHGVDFQNCAHGIGTLAPYCPNLAALAGTGVNYTLASTSKPSDSFPGIVALIAGASPRSAGVYYDVSYTRELFPPGSTCTGTPGTAVVYDETVDINTDALDAGGGIDPNKLPRALDSSHQCVPVFPRNFIRVNTIFGVARAAGLYTAWSDKHPAYDIVRGATPLGGVNNSVNDLNSPEINSLVVPVNPGLPSDPNFPTNCSVPDPSNQPGGVWTGSFKDIKCYDMLKVKILLNEIDGKKSDGTSSAPVPAIFGMNFQAVSVGQKLIDGGNVQGGYVDSVADPLGALGKPTASLLGEIKFVDSAIGKLVAELKAKGLYNSTTIIISAKHGQSPIDINRLNKINSSTGRPTKLLSSLIAGSSEDDISILWLKNSSDTNMAVKQLEINAAAAGIGQIFAGPSINLLFGDPAQDLRVPDIVVQPNVGVIYTGSTKKVAEHGGFAEDDTHVMMLVANPQLTQGTVSSPVETAQVAPTILKLLGLDPNALTGVQMEGTQVLPGLKFPQNDHNEQ